MEYLIALEAGLRMTAKDKSAMGKFGYSSRENYHKIELWRKREAYIGVCRLILGCGNYLKYVSYRWADYVLRGQLGKTFLARHWRLTNGESDALSSAFPDDFSSSRNSPVAASQPNQNKSSKSTRSKSTSSKSTSSS